MQTLVGPKRDGSTYLRGMDHSTRLTLPIAALVTLAFGGASASADAASAGFGYDDPRSEQISRPADLIAAGSDGVLVSSYNGPVRKYLPGRRSIVVAGGGERRVGSKPIPATDASIFSAGDMSRSFGGGFLIAIAGGTSVEEVRHGSIRRVVKDFGGPTGLAALPDGGAVVSSQFRYEIVRSTPGGDLSTIAGTGQFGITPDGEPAAGNPIGSPLDVARLSDGDVVFSEYAGDYQAIREIRPDGTLETLAGGPGLGFGGDGGPAVDATLGLVYDLAVEADGGILIADDHRVRRIGTDGIIETVAGTGETRYNGDRIAATDANLFPSSLSATNDGGFLIGDFANGRIRRVAPDGEITTIAGIPAPSICEKARYNGIQGEPGRDDIRGQKRRDLIRGETGDDDLGGRGGRDCIAGGLDDDEVDGGSKGDGIDAENGNDHVDGGKGDDAIDGQGGRDSLHGEEGNDRVYGGFDDDRLVGGAGDDLLDGNTGLDRFSGGRGNDYIDAQFNERESSQPVADRIRCGPGRDTVKANTYDRIGRDCEVVKGAAGNRER